MLEDSKGRFWIGTWSDGLYLYDYHNNKIINYIKDNQLLNTINSFAIASLYEDRQGQLWIGTYDAGINKIDPFSKKFELFRAIPYKKESLSDNMIWSFMHVDNELWITTENGINILNNKTGVFKRAFENMKIDKNIRVMYKDSKGIIWLGSGNEGLYEYDKTNNKFVNYKMKFDDGINAGYHSIWAICEDNNSRYLWVGNYRAGIVKFDKINKKFTRPFNGDINAFNINSIVKDKKGIIWAGTSGKGLLKIQNDKVKMLNPENSKISSKIVKSLFVDKKDILWIGTTNGLNRLNPETEKYELFNVSNGLPNDVIYSITEDKNGNIWFSTNGGLCMLNYKSKIVKTYDINDGLQDNEFNRNAALNSEDGSLYFGGINGFNRFNPDYIYEN